jgi:hypothetical protein
MLQKRPTKDIVVDLPKFGSMVSTKAESFKSLTKLVVAISILLALLMVVLK